MPRFVRVPGGVCLHISFVCILCCSSLVFAQEERHQPYPENPFFTESRDAIPRRDRDRSIRNAELQNYHNGASFFQNRPDFIDPWSRDLEKDGESYKPTTKVAPTKKVSHLNYFAPMEGQLAGMKAGAYAELLDKGMEGALTEYNITLTQTEPALAAGLHNAYVQAGIALTNRYMAEDNFNEQLKAHPHARDQITGAYNSCVYRLMHGISKDEKTEDKKKMSWVEAVAVCSGDSLEDPDEAFENGDLASAKTKPDHWKGHDHPDENKTLSDPHNNDENQISVVDMLFGQLIKNASGSGANSADEIKKQRTAWLEWFGDYLIHTDSSGGSSRLIREEKVEAVRDASAVLLKIQDDRYEDVLKMLTSLCEAKQYVITSPERLIEADENNPWAYENESFGVPDELIHKLSTQGAPFNSLMGEVMLGTFVKRHIAGKRIGDSDSKTFKDLDCKETFNPDSGVCAADSVQANESYIDTCTGYWRYASLVGAGQYISSLRAAERFVMERTSGLREGELASLGLKLIYDTSKTGDLEGLQIQNLVKLEELRQLFISAQAQGSGSGSFTSTIKNKNRQRSTER